MGEIRKYACICGYERELFTGGGLGGCNVRHIARFFPKEVQALERERSEGRISRYVMENEVSVCQNCRELYALPAFSYTRKDGYTCHFAGSCPDCGSSVARVEDEERPECPKCGQKMQYLVAGDWD